MTEIDLTPVTRLEYDIDAILNDHAVAEPITRIELILADIVAGNTTTVEPVTRIETYLAIISGADYPVPEPVTRIETFLAIIAGEDYETPEAVTRLEGLLAEWVEKGSAIWKTVTGTLIHITDALASPMQKCEVSLEPIQSGSGDPSPTNVRPITGWTGCEVWVKDEYDTTLPATLSVTFPDTVYGGKHEFIGGTGDSAWKSVTLNGSESWSVNVSGGHARAQRTFSDAYSFSGEYTEISEHFLCSHFKNEAWEDVYVGKTGAGQTGQTIGFGIDFLGISDQAAWKAWLSNNPIQLVYEVATPTKISLTPQPISTLKGENNVWSNGDSVEITYKAQAE